MTGWPEHVAGVTTHARRGAIGNVFRYGVDYVLIDPGSCLGPRLFSRNHFNLISVHDRDHGGPQSRSRGLVWAREVFERAGMSLDRISIRLLTQPSFLGYIFNPVSFWFALDGESLVGVIAEVNNPFGDRHSYLCHLPEFSTIHPGTRLSARKIMHVSPYQHVAGQYHFTFHVGRERILIRIFFENGGEGVIATFSGRRRPLGSGSIIQALLRRPFGALRTIFLIYWQALRLRLKGAVYRTRPVPPEHEVS